MSVEPMPEMLEITGTTETKPPLNRKARRQLLYAQKKQLQQQQQLQQGEETTLVQAQDGVEVKEGSALKRHKTEEESKEKQNDSNTNKKQKQKKAFPYGNFDRYYGYRLYSSGGKLDSFTFHLIGVDCLLGRKGENDQVRDMRLDVLKREWFEGRCFLLRIYNADEDLGMRCIDVGCNNGFFSSRIAKSYRCAYMLGIDIDPKLILQVIMSFL
jgi:hypothetical protein